MDYRAFNKVTVKDKFTIPLVDELLDEFWGSNFLSWIFDPATIKFG
jgi:hypothetical protein